MAYGAQDLDKLRQALSGRLSPATPPLGADTPSPLHQRLQGAPGGVSVEAPGTAPATGTLERLMGAIQGKESGGNPTIANKHTGAYGLFQIMPNNWAPWSKEAGLAGAARTPENQTAVARYKLGQYLEQFGPAGAAAAWYGGPGRAKESSYWDKSQGRGNTNYPTIRQYVNDILKKMG